MPIGQLIKATGPTHARRAKSSEPYQSNKTATEVLVKLELLPATNYLPDVELIKPNRVKLFMGIGEWALKRKTWIANIAQILAERLGCELVIFPGHHGSFMDMPDEFAATHEVSYTKRKERLTRITKSKGLCWLLGSSARI